MFKSGEGKKLGEQLISEMSKLRTEKEHLLHAKEKARKAQEAKAATARKLAEEKEAKLQAEQMELERKRQEEEAASRKKAAQEAARCAEKILMNLHPITSACHAC